MPLKLARIYIDNCMLLNLNVNNINHSGGKLVFFFSLWGGGRFFAEEGEVRMSGRWGKQVQVISMEKCKYIMCR